MIHDQKFRDTMETMLPQHGLHHDTQLAFWKAHFLSASQNTVPKEFEYEGPPYHYSIPLIIKKTNRTTLQTTEPVCDFLIC